MICYLMTEELQKSAPTLAQRTEMSPEALPGGPAQRRGEGIAKGRTTSQPRTTTKKRQPGGELGWKKTQVPWGMVSAQDVATYAKAPQWPFHPKGTNPEGSRSLSAGALQEKQGVDPTPPGVLPTVGAEAPKGKGSCLETFQRLPRI